MIIVEGPDGAGKTTLVEHLSTELGIPVAGKVVQSDAKTTHLDLKRWTEDNLAAGCRAVMFDRHRLISEPIYGSVLRWNMAAPGFDDICWLTDRHAELRAIKPYIIFCLPPIETVQANIRNDPSQPMRIKRHIGFIYSMYFNEAARWKTAQIYNYSDKEHRNIRPTSVHEITRGVERWMAANRFPVRSSAAG